MAPLETVGLCILVFACLLYRIEKKVSESVDCYGIVYDTGRSLCSLVPSILPLVAEVPLLGLGHVQVIGHGVDT